MLRVCWINWSRAPGDTITLERTQLVLGTASATAVTNLTAAWLANDGSAGLAVINEALATGTDPRQFCRQMVSYLRQLLLLQTAGSQLQLDVPDQERATMQEQANRANRQTLIETIKRFNDASVTAANTWQPQLPLELAFIESLLAPEGAMIPTPSMPAPIATTPAEPAQVQSLGNAKGRDVSATEPTPTGTTASPQPAESKPTLPAPEPAQVQTEPKPTADAIFNLQQIQAQWQSFMTQCGSHDRNLPPLLAMCKPLATEGSTLVLGFDFPILREKFDQPENKETVATILTNMFGGNRLVKAVVTGDYSPPSQAGVSRDDFERLANELGGVVSDN